jgi:hypothetical protein
MPALPRQVLATAIALAAAAAAAAQQASYTTFGQGCPPIFTRSSPTLITEGVPQLGNAFTVAVEDGGRAPVGRYWDWLLVGTSNTSWNGVPLPLWSAPLAGCPLLVSPDIVLPVVPGAPRSFGFSVPNDPRLTGVKIYQQWVIGWATGTSPPVLFSASNGGIAELGI